jgi:C1A family cysteine protease
MKITIALLLAGSASASLYTKSEQHQQFMWKSFVEEHGKEYASAADERHRFNIFIENLKLIDARNKNEKGTATHGITKFADLSPEEFKTGYLTLRDYKPSNNTKLTGLKPLLPGASASADWTGTYTTPVKDQGYCGSCWAFSVTEQVESDWLRTGDGSMPILSAQQVTSCTSYRLPGVGGCNGGKPESGYTYAEAGLVLDSDYPYTSGQRGVTGDCDIPSGAAAQVKTTSYTNVANSASDESTMAAYVSSTGPLSIVVDASEWSSYTGGILSTCGQSLDHAVQVVGIDTDEGSWKVRNSWGTSWGESGFIRLAYGDNTCGIASDANYATVTSA